MALPPSPSYPNVIYPSAYCAMPSGKRCSRAKLETHPMRRSGNRRIRLTTGTEKVILLCPGTRGKRLPRRSGKHSRHWRRITMLTRREDVRRRRMQAIQTTKPLKRHRSILLEAHRESRIQRPHPRPQPQPDHQHQGLRPFLNQHRLHLDLIHPAVGRERPNLSAEQNASPRSLRADDS